MYITAHLFLTLCGITVADLLPRHADAPTTVADATEPLVTAITDCHVRESALYCSAGGDEYHVQTTVTATTAMPAQFTDCHAHESDLFCVGPGGHEVMAVNESKEHDHSHGEEDDHAHEEGNSHEDKKAAVSSSGQKCHFHAGVEHCTGGSEVEQKNSCDATPRDYNIPLRVGLLFVILTTSAIGVFGPILLHKILPDKFNLLFIVLKQFGTGIIVSTAFIHLFTHASLMFNNECLGELGYEGTTSAILMAGIFLSFFVEYIGQRVVQAKIRSESALTFKEKAGTLLNSDIVSILVMEGGIIFHSLLIGLTLVVAGDSFFLTLFIVILFHQVFEGIALGTRIATLGESRHPLATSEELLSSNSDLSAGPDVTSNPNRNKSPTHSENSAASSGLPVSVSMQRKLALAALFAFITPIGMAIGIGVLKHFNGNDKSTLIAIGTLNAVSAGILVWVGVVEMWAGDWMSGSHGHKAELADADMLTVALAGFGLVAGFVVMSFLGKWA